MENQTDQNKYKKYFIRDVVRGAMKEEWGDEMIREQGQSESAGQNRHEIEGEASGGKMKSSPLRRKE